jgi:ABC-type lipoprotein export system ATPase subunit
MTTKTIRKAASVSNSAAKKTEAKKNAKNTFKHIHVAGGFLDGFDYDFSDKLNCIIGSRGAGKTTILELLRYAMNALPLDSEAQKKLQAIVESNLGGGHIDVTVETGDKVNYIISRKAGEPPQVFFGDHSPSGMVFDPSMFPLDVFSQNEIEKNASQSAYQMALLESFNMVALSDLNNEIARCRRELDRNAANLLPLQEQERELVAVLNAMPGVKKRLDEFDSDGTGDESSMTHAHYMKDIRGLETRYIDNAEKILSDSESRINPLKDFLMERLKWNGVGNLEDGENYDLIERANAVLAEHNANLNRHVQEYLEGIRDAFQSFAEIKDDLAIRHQKQEMEYDSLVEKSREEQQRAAERRKIGDEYQKLLVADKEHEKIRTGIRETVEARNVLKQELYRLLNERFEIRREIADRINEKLNPDIRVTVNQFANKEKYIELIEGGLKGTRMHYHKVAASLANIFPEDLVRIIVDNKQQTLVEEAQLSSDQAAIVTVALKNPKFLAALEVVDIPDRVKIELNDRGKFKPTECLSTGQKCNAILPILLLESERPLLIDQPEDNLDNEYVHSFVVENIKRVKEHRQLIFVTHNPNIPVLGDAESVLVVESDGSYGHLRRTGSVDDCKSDIINLLEGGKEAFKERQERYAI